MKKLSNITFAAILLGGVQLLQTGCTDMEGDGIGSIEWGGSRLSAIIIRYGSHLWKEGLWLSLLLISWRSVVRLNGP